MEKYNCIGWAFSELIHSNSSLEVIDIITYIIILYIFKPFPMFPGTDNASLNVHAHSSLHTCGQGFFCDKFLEIELIPIIQNFTSKILQKWCVSLKSTQE